MAGFSAPGDRRGTLANYGVADPLFGRLAATEFPSLIKVNGTFHQVDVVSPEEIDVAELVFLGGRDYVVSDETADELTAAGYGEWLFDLPLAYGEGVYGFGIYGQGSI